MKWIKGISRFLLVTVGIIVLTSFTIDATQHFSGSQSALSILTQTALEEGCPAGTQQLDLSSGSICVDIYEVSVGDACPIQSPSRALETKQNIEAEACQAVSIEDALPWTSVTYLQAKELCAKRDMRLLTNTEWFEAGLGTSDTEKCNISGSLVATGAMNECVSSRGVFDMVGNVWEWVDADVTNGMYNERALPSEGYVSEVDVAGVAAATDNTPSEMFNEDYFWSEAEGVFAMMRGGFYGSRKDAGLYSIHADISTNFSGPAIGFRCVQ